MYALVHRDAEQCSHVLTQVGFHVRIVDPPVRQEEIQGEFLRTHIHTEWCCGADEFIKLYAYQAFDEPLFVHVDIDFAFVQPMDEVFDALLYDGTTPRGQAARQRILVERGGVLANQSGIPTRIDAFWTRDWSQIVPGYIPGMQAGFWVAKRDPSILKELIAIIRVGHYEKGWGKGWGNQGYGRYVGSMAMQGLMAYYYDVIRPNTSAELNPCRYNHMGMTVKYTAHPNFRPKHPQVGECRNNRGDDCEECTHTHWTKSIVFIILNVRQQQHTTHHALYDWMLWIHSLSIVAAPSDCVFAPNVPS